MLKDNIYKPLIDILKANEDLKDVVQDRIWYGLRPQTDALPSIRMSTFGLNPSPSKDGVSTVDIVAVGMDVYAKDPNTAFYISRLIRDTIDGIVNKTQGENILQGIRFLEWEDDPEGSDKSDVYAVYNSYEVRIVRIDSVN